MALVLVPEKVASSVLATAAQVVPLAAGTATLDHASTQLGTAVNWGECHGLGTTQPWASQGQAGLPSGNGWLFDPTGNGLQGQLTPAGTWNAQLVFSTSVGTLTADILLRAYVRDSNGVYTVLGTSRLNGQTLTTTATAFAMPAISLPQVKFLEGYSFYADIWLNVTANANASSTLTINLNNYTDNGQGSISNGLAYLSGPDHSAIGGLTVLHAGQDITAVMDESTIDIQRNLGSGPGAPSGHAGRAGTAEFTAYLGPAASAIGAGQSLPVGKLSLVRYGETVIYDATGTIVFGGFASLLNDDSDKQNVLTDITCHDYWEQCAHIIVNEVYVAQTDVYILTDLFTKYAPWVDISVLTSMPANFTFDKRYMRAKTLKAAIKVVTDVTAFNVWVDEHKVFHYESPGSASTAPFSLSSTPDFGLSYPMKVTKHTVDDTSIINRVTFYGGTKPSNDYTQDMSYQANGTNNSFIFAYFPHESSTGKIQVLVNGVQKVVGEYLHSGTANQLKSDGGTADCLVNADAETLTFDPTEIPAAGATVTAIYRYENPLVLQIADQKSVSFFGNYYDGHLSDTQVRDITTATIRCKTLLAQQAYGLEHLEVTCWQPGLYPGQMLRVDDTLRNIHNTYLVQQVKTAPLNSEGGAGNFEYQVACGAWNWNIIDLMMLAAQHETINDTSENEDTTVIQSETLSEALLVHDSVAVITTPSGTYTYAGSAHYGRASYG